MKRYECKEEAREDEEEERSMQVETRTSHLGYGEIKPKTAIE